LLLRRVCWLRLLQRAKGIALVNGYLAYRYITVKEPSCREFTDSVALAICVKVDCGEGGDIDGAAHGARQAAMEAGVARAHPGPLPHALFSGRALGLGGKDGDGVCRLCHDKHASGVCKTCSVGLETDKPKPFWMCYPGKHGRQCYCRHLTVDAKP
jgi:hypothetical protein